MVDQASDQDLDYDVVVIGSGFGGSVTALRASEKGYRVGVLEAGRRFTPETLPRTWAYLVAGCVVAVSMAFALFLLARQIRLAREPAR